jgi:hypothetical protein
MSPKEQQQRANRRQDPSQASVALVFALGFMAKIAFLGH